MNVSQKAFEMMKLDMTKELIVMLMEEENMEMETAMNVLYLSETYEKCPIQIRVCIIKVLDMCIPFWIWN